MSSSHAGVESLVFEALKQSKRPVFAASCRPVVDTAVPYEQTPERPAIVYISISEVKGTVINASQTGVGRDGTRHMLLPSQPQPFTTVKTQALCAGLLDQLNSDNDITLS